MCWIDIINLFVGIVSAIATFAATVIALWLALQGQLQRIDCVFMQDTATNIKPMLILNNIGNHTVIVERVDLYFHKQKIGSIDILRTPDYSKHAIISPNTECRIAIDTDSMQQSIKRGFAKKPHKLYKMTAVVITTNKKRYKSSYKCSYNELMLLFFNAGLFAE